MDIKKNTLAYFDSKDTAVQPFQFFIEKAIISKDSEDVDSTEWVIEGVASTTNIDHDGERMTDSALKGMADIINEKSVPLRVEHQKGDEGVIGDVYQASIDARGKLIIKARLNKASNVAKMLYEGLKSGAKMGLSVGGQVVSAVRELAESAGKYVKTFYKVLLSEVSVTPRPSNFDAWLFSKSITTKDEDTAPYYGTNFYNTFLFENPHLDYIQAIEKSIPSLAWVKVDKKADTFQMKKNILVKDMVTAEDVDGAEKATDSAEAAVEEKEESTHDAEKADTAVESKEPLVGKSYVDKKFNEFRNEVVSLLKEIRKDITANGTQTAEPIAPNEPADTDVEGKVDEAKVDSINPVAKLNEPPADEEVSGKVTSPKVDPLLQTAKDATDESDKKEEKASSTDSMAMEADKDMDAYKDADEVESKTEKDEETGSYGGDYQMNTLKSVLKGAMAKGMNPIDVLVAYVTNHTETLKKSLAASGKRVIGLENMIADSVRNNEEIQKSLREWMSTPGQKRSVSLGAPYMVTKEGSRFRLLAEEVGAEKVQKSKSDFKSVYNASFSSGATGEEIR